VADQTRRLYFFESALAPNVFWVDLKKIDFSPETGRTRRLDLGQYQRTIHSGEANAQFEETAPFRFLGV